MKKPSPSSPLPIDNLDRATFKCVFPVCGGICCKNGRPPVTPEEQKRIRANLPKFLPHLREKARKIVAAGGWIDGAIGLARDHASRAISALDGLPSSAGVDGLSAAAAHLVDSVEAAAAR